MVRRRGKVPIWSESALLEACKERLQISQPLHLGDRIQQCIYNRKHRRSNADSQTKLALRSLCKSPSFAF